MSVIRVRSRRYTEYAEGFVLAGEKKKMSGEISEETEPTGDNEVMRVSSVRR